MSCGDMVKALEGENEEECVRGVQREELGFRKQREGKIGGSRERGGLIEGGGYSGEPWR